MNICGKFGCRKVATNRCPCKTIFYCSKECGYEMWDFHKSGCKFSLEDIPLQKQFILPEQLRFVQLYNVVDALDRTNRIVPLVNVHADEGEPRLQKFISTALRIDEVCKCKRALNFNVAPSSLVAKRGEDSFKQLVAQEFPPQLVARSMMFGKSLSFCVTICSVIEVLCRHAGYVCLHGCEKISNYFIARGLVRTLRPRLNFTEWKDETTVDSQAVDNFCILFVPESRYHFEEHAVPGLERAAKIDAESEQIKKERSKLYTKWHKELQKNSTDEPTEWSTKTAEIFSRIGSKCIFLAPAAGEHDETLYANSYSIGVPSWFQIKEIFSSRDLELMTVQEEIQSYVSGKSRQILVDLLGKNRAEAAVQAAIDSAQASPEPTEKPTTIKEEVLTQSNEIDKSPSVATVEDCKD